MKKTLLILGLATVGISSATASVIVNWGGDYVTTGNVNYNNAGNRAVSAVANAYPSGTGRSKSVSWNESTQLSPTASYSGTSATFYGGYFDSHDGTVTTAGSITATARITNSGTTDQLYYRFQTPSDATKTTVNVGGGISWLKSDFLSFSAGTPSFDSTSSLSMNIATISGSAAVRWAVKEGSQWYISNTSYTTNGAKSLSGVSLTGETWLAFDPATVNMLQPTGSYAAQTFSNITGVGYFGWANLTGSAATTTDIVLTSFAVDAVPEPATWALLVGSLTTVMILRRRRRA